MPLVIADRVRETSTTTGTGTLTLDGAVTGFRTFSSAIGNTNTCYYTITLGSDWEVGIGTVGAGTLARTTILKSSNSNNAVNFSAGTKDVFVTYPADRSVASDYQNVFSVNQVISVTDNTNAALRITQLGTANALVVEDSANPDSTPFVINASGSVGIGLTSPTVALDVIGVIEAQEALTQDAIRLAGRAGGTGSFAITLTPAALSASRTLTLPEPGENVTLGYLNIPQNSQSAAYTLVLTDSGKHIFHPSADTTARTWTIPANGSVAFPVGTAITFVNQNGAGVITISITTDTMRLAGTGSTGNRTLAANGVATAIKVTSTEWIISGTGLT